MARVTITQDNIDRSKIIPPGKYLMDVAEYEQNQAGTDGSDLWVYTLKVAEGEHKGATARFQVSEKAEGMGYEFWGACGAALTPGTSLDPASFKGKKVWVQIQRGEYKGKPQNVPVSFSKVDTPQAVKV